MVRRAVLATLAAAILIAGAAYVIIPPPYPGIFDANLNRLAETPAEARCAGTVGWETRFRGDRAKMKKCVKLSTLSNEIDHSQVIMQFCLGITDVGDARAPSFTQCTGVVVERRLWPTRDGSITGEFNDEFPWPGDLFPGVPSSVGNSRTGERSGFERQFLP